MFSSFQQSERKYDDEFSLLDRSDLSIKSTGSSSSKKTPFQVFVAKYSYDPVEFSPNENPESELAISAGDYIFVYGEMDPVSEMETYFYR